VDVALAGLAATALCCEGARPHAVDCDEPWRHDAATWLRSVAALCGLAAAAVAATVAVLRAGDRRPLEAARRRETRLPGRAPPGIIGP
jgi:hypothetical protein